MNTLWKILAVLMITAGGAALTCGGNTFLIYPKFREGIFVIWGIEILAIFIWSIHKFFFKTTTWKSQTPFMKILIFGIPIFGLIFTYFFLQAL